MEADRIPDRIQNSFQAKWDSEIAHLKPQQDSHCWKQVKLFLDIITLGLARCIRLDWAGNLAKRIILPAAQFDKMEVRQIQEDFDLFWFGPVGLENGDLRSQFKAEKHEVITPDGAKLNATRFIHRDAGQDSTTLIYFQPNSAFSAFRPDFWLLKHSIDAKTPMNFVVFDYRGTGSSQGTFESANDLQIDGSSIVQWVREELKTPDDRIHFYGRSLGGAIAAQTMGLYANRLKGCFVSERSFSSTDDLIPPFIGKPLSYLLAPLVQWIVKAKGFDIDAVSPFQKLKGRNLVIYHPEDQVIPFEASLFKRVQMIPHRSFELRLSLDLPASQKNYHNLPLSYFTQAEEEISRFLFGR